MRGSSSNLGRFVASAAALSLFAGCAAIKSPVYNPKATKCYVVDSTRSISADEHARIFKAVGDQGFVFPACPDSSGDGAWAYDARVRPVKTVMPSRGLSYGLLGVNASLWAAGGGLAFAYEAPLWLLLPLLNPAPHASVVYRGDYLDAKGKARHVTFAAGGEDAWFKSADESRAIALEGATSGLAWTLFSVPRPKPKRPDYFGRASLDIGPLVFARRNNGLWLDAHFEKFFPHRFTFDVSPGAYLPFTIDDRIFSVYAGPRWYPFEAHQGLFIGLEPYAETRDYRGGRYNRYALPVTFGFVAQERRFVTGLDFGVGPSTTAGGAYDDAYMVLGSFYFGWAF